MRSVALYFVDEDGSLITAVGDVDNAVYFGDVSGYGEPAPPRRMITGPGAPSMQLDCGVLRYCCNRNGIESGCCQLYKDNCQGGGAGKTLRVSPELLHRVLTEVAAVRDNFADVVDDRRRLRYGFGDCGGSCGCGGKCGNTYADDNFGSIFDSIGNFFKKLYGSVTKVFRQGQQVTQSLNDWFKANAPGGTVCVVDPLCPGVTWMMTGGGGSIVVAQSAQCAGVLTASASQVPGWISPICPALPREVPIPPTAAGAGVADLIHHPLAIPVGIALGTAGLALLLTKKKGRAA